MNGFDLLIFDLDGTLLDTALDVLTSTNLALEKMDLPAVTADRLKKAIGPGAEVFAEIVLGKENFFRMDEFFALYRPIYHEKCLENTKPFADIPVLLMQMKRNKIFLSVATNKPLIFSAEILEQLQLAQYFDFIAGPEKVTKVKPDPEMINFLIDHFSVKKEKTLVIGDTRNDILAARHAGARSCAAGWGYTSHAELYKLRPDFFAMRPLDIVQFIFNHHAEK